jgi:hypothetical protein
MSEPLVDRMWKWADDHTTDIRRGEMRNLADALDRAITNLDAEDGVKRMLGAWARARRYWCEVTGEPLI